jgi:hypothetical protein
LVLLRPPQRHAIKDRHFTVDQRPAVKWTLGARFGCVDHWRGNYPVVQANGDREPNQQKTDDGDQRQAAAAHAVDPNTAAAVWPRTSER